MPRLLLPLLVVWLIALTIGIRLMVRYESVPGRAEVSLPVWPASSHIPHNREGATLVMLAHPRCPCTRASLEELAQIMARFGEKAQAVVIFVTPRQASQEWMQTDLWRSAAMLPGVMVVRDEGGVEAARFHAHTSGETRLYDASGSLLFQGGITSGRGHIGDNAGQEAIMQLLAGGKNAIHKIPQTPVFGCALREDDSNPASLIQENRACRK